MYEKVQCVKENQFVNLICEIKFPLNFLFTGKTLDGSKLTKQAE